MANNKFDTASLVLIPSGIKAGKIYAQKPHTGDGDFDFVRGSEGAYFNSVGSLQYAEVNDPRLDWFYPITGGVASCPALLVEGAATNRIRNNTMTGAVAGTPGTLPANWSDDGTISGVGFSRQVVGTGTENGVNYIDIRFFGTATASTFYLAFEGLSQIAASSGQTFATSFYCKLINSLSTPVTQYRIITNEWDLTPFGFVTTTRLAIALTGSLTRFSLLRTIVSALTDSIQPAIEFLITAGQTYNFTVRIGLPQMEQSSIVTSVIRTTTAAVTRNADVAKIITGVSDSLGQTEGVLYAKVLLTTGSQSPTLGGGILTIKGDPTTRTNAVDIIRDTVNNSVRFILVSAGVVRFNVSAAVVQGVNKLAFSYRSGVCAFFINGVKVGADATAFSFTEALDVVRLGKYQEAAGDEMNGRIAEAYIYKNSMADADLIELTTL